MNFFEKKLIPENLVLWNESCKGGEKIGKKIFGSIWDKINTFLNSFEVASNRSKRRKRPAFGMMPSCFWKGRIWNPSSEYADHNSILCFFLVSYLLDFSEKNPQKESRPKKRNGLQKISYGLLWFTVLISNDVALNSDCFRRYSTNPWIAFSYRNVFSGSASAVS